MFNWKHSLLGFALAATALVTANAPAQAQDDYPKRPITLVVPWSPGGAADIIARLLAEPMSEALGQPVVVENRPGAGGTVGSALVANAEPDGYTILMGNVASQGIAAAFYKDTIPYDVLEDFTPVTQLIQQPNVLLVQNDFEAQTMDDLVTYLKDNPGEIYATPGVGNSPYLTFELIKNRYGLDMINVPYDSGAEVNNALAAGQVMIAINNLPESITATKNGAARPIAVTAPERNPLLPDVPTFKELGQDIVAISWQGLFVPAGTPDEIVTKLYDAAVLALEDPDVVARNADLGSVPVGSSPAEFHDFVASELNNWAEMVALAAATEANK
ncbi:Bug family tripartite tricarboxylate transporter substrate binding protein [Celeribacter sp. SCSIO 80788]|uniref:Bug family tripartite tricarboxylate transporter substrate binding protein n=1 Tax=Celeribacter sp. SCSIO 80788 TaxID=3117013 RepID=UPI003DA65869